MNVGILKGILEVCVVKDMDRVKIWAWLRGRQFYGYRYCTDADMLEDKVKDIKKDMVKDMV